MLPWYNEVPDGECMCDFPYTGDLCEECKHTSYQNLCIISWKIHKSSKINKM